MMALALLFVSELQGASVTGAFPFAYNWTKYPGFNVTCKRYCNHNIYAASYSNLTAYFHALAAWFAANSTNWEDEEQLEAIGKYSMAILGWQHLDTPTDWTAVVYTQVRARGGLC